MHTHIHKNLLAFLLGTTFCTFIAEYQLFVELGHLHAASRLDYAVTDGVVKRKLDRS